MFQRQGSVARWKRQSPRSTRPGTRAQTTMPACAKRASTGGCHGVSTGWISAANWPALTTSSSATSGSNTPSSRA